MAAKDSEPKQWTDPKDYGLPFVEITPLPGKSVSIAKEVTPEEKPETNFELESAETIISESFEVKSEPVEPKTEVVKPAQVSVEKPSSTQSKQPEKSTTWVWAVILIGLGILAVIVWQLMAEMKSSSSELKPETKEEIVAKKPELSPVIEQESTPTEQNQNPVNQDSIKVINNSNPNISKPAETGTTIANVGQGKLIRIESKAERPQYFIVVGSLPNEKLAIEEANQYFSKSTEIYLISPEEGSRNYRLALSNFTSFRLAAEELERIKSQYSEELWILKY